MHLTKVKNIAFAFIICCLGLFSCNSSVHFEAYHEFEQNTWNVKDIAEFEFDIDNPAASFDLAVNIRHNSQYLYNNLYITYSITDADNKEIHNGTTNLQMFDVDTGKPMGQGTSDLYNYQQVIFPNFKVAKAGKYKIRLTQYMREGELKNILAAGIRLSYKK